jgi:hypothetical protein
MVMVNKSTNYFKKTTMKTGKTIFRATMITGTLAAILLLGSCKKSSSSSSSTSDNTNAASLSANGASTDNTFDDVLNVTIQTNQDKTLNSIIARQSGTTTNGVGTPVVLGSFYCATVTVTPADTSNFPKSILVDFGSGCTSQDGIARSGSITYILSERFRYPGAVITASFNNYKVNGYQLNGTYTLTNNSSLAGVAYTTSVTDGSIIFPNDSSYSFAGTKTVTQTAGIGSTDLSTYVFSVTGNYTISNTSTGESLSAKVTTPLVKEETCPFIVSGKDSFTYSKGSLNVSGTLDYGSGTCDSTASVTIGSITNTVTLH